MTEPLARTFPHGVTSWVDVDLPDVDAGIAFYAALFGWTFADATPPDAPFRYVIARLGGRDVAASAGRRAGPLGGTRTSRSTTPTTPRRGSSGQGRRSSPARWTRVPADAPRRCSTRAVRRSGSGRPGPRLGVQVANEPGAWNFSHLHSADPAAARDFYGPVLGWTFGDSGFVSSVSVPGYGDHLEATVDPDIRTRQAHAPDGFADVVAAFVPLAEDETPHWQVVFSVADRDASVAVVESLGGVVVSTADDQWVRTAVVRDPQGAELVVSQFAPQDW